MDFDLLIQRKRERFEQLEREIADPSLFENRNRAGEIMREHANVKALLAKWNELSSARMQLAEIANWPIRPTPTSPKWRRKKFPPSKNASPDSNARCSWHCFHRMKMKIATQSLKSVQALAEARRQFSRPICTECTIAMPSQPD